jgi:hypothetical protein
MAEKTETDKTVDWMKEQAAKVEQDRREQDERARQQLVQQAWREQQQKK